MTAALAAWQSFYVIVGSSGGALIGLQFVVMTLIADKQHRTSAGAHLVISASRGGAPKRH